MNQKLLGKLFWVHLIYKMFHPTSYPPEKLPFIHNEVGEKPLHDVGSLLVKDEIQGKPGFVLPLKWTHPWMYLHS